MAQWLGCATSAPVVRRALACALVVGPVLVAINHGDAIVAGEITVGRLVRIALTLLVPYAVSTFSSVQAVISRAPLEGATAAVTEVSDG